MVVTRNPKPRSNTLELNSVLQHHAGGKLTGALPENLLPRGLALDKKRRESPPPLRQLFIRNQDVRAAPVEIDADAVARAKKSQIAANGRFGGCVQDRRAPRGAALPPVANTGKFRN